MLHAILPLLFSVSAMAMPHSNPHGYSIMVTSPKAAEVFDGAMELVRTLKCDSHLQADGTYLVSCPKSLNGDAAFASTLYYYSSADEWDSADEGTLAFDDEPPVPLICSAGGTSSPTVPSFQLFLCTFEGQ